jgi:hypothetical protein
MMLGRGRASASAAADYGPLRLIYQRLSGAVQASVRPAGMRVREGNTRFPNAKLQEKYDGYYFYHLKRRRP